jgi:LuxR family quorum-sensing system transcriptional regulator CciR
MSFSRKEKIGMPQLSDVTRFVELSNSAKTLNDLGRLMADITREMGFDVYALVQHVDVSRSNNDENVWLENYPSSWAEAFVARGLYASDPIHVASQFKSAGFLWSQVGEIIRLTAHHRRVLAEARKEGLADGFTIPAHLPGQGNISCSFGMKTGRAVPSENLMMAQLIASFAFEAAWKLIKRQKNAPVDRPKLTQRQLDCLVLVARGKTDWEIASILGVKEATVTDYIVDACARYNVRRRVQLVMRAVHDGHMTLRDTIG